MIINKIELGLIAPTLSEQLNKLNIKYDSMKVEHFETDRQALNRIRMRNLIPPSQLNKAYDKLWNRINTHLNEIDKCVQKSGDT